MSTVMITMGRNVHGGGKKNKALTNLPSSRLSEVPPLFRPFSDIQDTFQIRQEAKDRGKFAMRIKDQKSGLQLHIQNLHGNNDHMLVDEAVEPLLQHPPTEDLPLGVPPLHPQQVLLSFHPQEALPTRLLVESRRPLLLSPRSRIDRYCKRHDSPLTSQKAAWERYPQNLCPISLSEET